MILTKRPPPAPDLCAQHEPMLKPNIGTTDRRLRATAAGVLALLYLSGALPAAWGPVLLALAAMLALTALLRFCPLYPLFRLSTRKKTA